MENKMKDEILINRFLSQDEEGFKMLVQKYQNQVVNIVYSLTGATSDAEDIAQEVFIKVYRSLKGFQKKAEFSTWLYRITVNTTYNYLKKQRKHLLSEYLDEAIPASSKPLKELEAKETQQMINKALEALPFKFRTAVVLKEIEGLSYKEIAKTLGCRIGTVESRLFRARQMLKRILTPILEREVANELR